jgi:hypothetical protein
VPRGRACLDHAFLDEQGLLEHVGKSDRAIAPAAHPGRDVRDGRIGQREAETLLDRFQFDDSDRGWRAVPRRLGPAIAPRERAEPGEVEREIFGNFDAAHGKRVPFPRERREARLHPLH